MSRKLIGMIMAIIVSLFFIGCPMNYTGATDTDGDGVPDSRDEDIDGDGLSNSEETAIWRTNPILEDTDGDGWHDGDEVNMGSMFNPLLANMPELLLEITTTPEIVLTGENSSSQQYEFTIAEGNSASSETTVSSSLSESRSLENAWSLEGMVGYGIGAEGFNCSLTTGYSGSYTVESGYSWGSEKTESNTKSIEQSKTYADEQSITYDGGILSVGARLYNPTNIAFTVDSLLVSGYRMNTLNSNYGQYSLLGSGNMTIDGFTSMTIPPNKPSGEFMLTQEFDSPEQAEALAQSCPSMIFSISGYSSSMTINEVDTDFTEEMTTVAGLCAKIIVSPGPGNGDSEQFLVAARTKYNPAYTTQEEMYTTLTLADILKNMGLVRGIDFLTDSADGRITSFNGIAEDTSDSSQWLVMVQDLDDGLDFYTAADGYDLDAIPIEPGYIVNICYSQDQDGDGLVLSMENLYGSSDTETDSDGDGKDDVDEVLGWTLPDDTTVYTNPALADTDGDGFDDGVDDDPVSFSTNTTADIYSVSVTDKHAAERVFTEEDYSFTGAEISGEYVKVGVEVLESVAGVTINGIDMTQDPGDDTLYTYEITTIPVGANEFAIQVTSQDANTVKDYTLTIESRLEDFTNLDLIDELLSTDGGKYQMDLGFNWGSYPDSRADGALLVYISGEEAATDYQIEETTLPPRTLKQNPTADVYDSGETAVYYWSATDEGAVLLETSAGSFFRASYYNRKYSFRIMPVAVRDGFYYYGPGTADASITTPYPDTIEVDAIDITYQWDDTSHSEGSPEFVINTDLYSAGDNGTKIMDITTRSLDYPWRPDDGDILIDETSIGVSFDIPSTNTNEIFRIVYTVDEDEMLGENNLIDSNRKLQFIGKSGDEIYAMNDNGKYAGTKLIDTQTYSDNDKGDFTMTWEVQYHSVDTE